MCVPSVNSRSILSPLTAELSKVLAWLSRYKGSSVRGRRIKRTLSEGAWRLQATKRVCVYPRPMRCPDKRIIGHRSIDLTGPVAFRRPRAQSPLNRSTERGQRQKRKDPPVVPRGRTWSAPTRQYKDLPSGRGCSHLAFPHRLCCSTTRPYPPCHRESF